ncbi:MAG: hypothetical protein ACYDCL_16760 [Myxococcales bacterium]
MASLCVAASPGPDRPRLDGESAPGGSAGSIGRAAARIGGAGAHDGASD